MIALAIYRYSHDIHVYILIPPVCAMLDKAPAQFAQFRVDLIYCYLKFKLKYFM